MRKTPIIKYVSSNTRSLTLEPDPFFCQPPCAPSKARMDNSSSSMCPTPTRWSFPPAFAGKIDEGEPVSMQFGVCLPTSCQAQTGLSEGNATENDEWRKMLVAAVNVSRSPWSFWFRSWASQDVRRSTDGYRQIPSSPASNAGFRQKDRRGAKGSGREVSPSQVRAPNLTSVPGGHLRHNDRNRGWRRVAPSPEPGKTAGAEGQHQSGREQRRAASLLDSSVLDGRFRMMG